MVMGAAIWLIVSEVRRNETEIHWCETAGGIAIFNRSHFKVCLRSDAVIERIAE